MPEPVRRKRLEVALWVLSLVLPLAFALRGIADVLLSQNFRHKKPRDASRLLPADDQHLWDLHYLEGWASLWLGSAFSPGARSPFSFFLTPPLLGAITTSMVRPSICGGTSMEATSARAVAISLRSSSAISG